MIVLDTNVVSEAMKPERSPKVTAWLDAQDANQLYVTTITLAELLFGIANVPAGRRKDMLAVALDDLLRLFGERVLSFDLPAANAYAQLASSARRGGRGLPLADGYIAAIASVHECSVATRDGAPFAVAGIRVIDPWNA